MFACFLVVLSKVSFWLAPCVSRHSSAWPWHLAERRCRSPAVVPLVRSSSLLLLLLAVLLPAATLAFPCCSDDVAQAEKVSGCAVSWRVSLGFFSALPSVGLCGGVPEGRWKVVVWRLGYTEEGRRVALPPLCSAFLSRHLSEVKYAEWQNDWSRIQRQDLPWIAPGTFWLTARQQTPTEVSVCAFSPHASQGELALKLW